MNDDDDNEGDDEVGNDNDGSDDVNGNDDDDIPKHNNNDEDDCDDGNDDEDDNDGDDEDDSDNDGSDDVNGNGDDDIPKHTGALMWQATSSSSLHNDSFFAHLSNVLERFAASRLGTIPRTVPAFFGIGSQRHFLVVLLAAVCTGREFTA